MARITASQITGAVARFGIASHVDMMGGNNATLFAWPESWGMDYTEARASGRSLYALGGGVWGAEPSFHSDACWGNFITVTEDDMEEYAESQFDAESFRGIGAMVTAVRVAIESEYGTR